MQADHSETIVLCHGYADCGLSWYYAMGGLTDNYELILLDARGHGLSDPPSAETPPDAQAEDIAGVIAALGLVKPIVMGHSMGSAAAMWFAARHPSRRSPCGSTRRPGAPHGPPEASRAAVRSRANGRVSTQAICSCLWFLQIQGNRF
jgi:pimeloyl-ACP methyl ester carboxylesterase